ncbi:3-alpha,7-alpha,12-alpha-trihydroxy-5-beta-cholest-24-enoyl-CoA hydratase [Verticiella sediminum]|uniref:3-alpha,7-alpha, 12-alpha-trihydroxy-5-beta-cholest-24-enoyl-CoA hydratase n=1 Tax=Verticiella sediminum TaxID=1247510 RepID=A0A556AKM8_9BURK|nr:MaoC/PaaZ C-terminal domain-containing protein [Verticiella sediminum]TSH93433.1 3-alpha,7-alpha,12-alpha-trihydroxy-5-beta-cholest-24-enoyl-CoA hydratase [Verticiella sediminum]
MPLDPQALASWRFPEVTQDYSDRDSLLYALSVGFGAVPTHPGEIDFVYEKQQRTVPTMAAVLCHPGVWLHNPAFGVTRNKVVHGEQRMRFHRPLPPAGRLRGTARVLAVEDKGIDKGAVVHLERSIAERDSGELYATIVHSTFCRADGGFGSGFGEAPALHVVPERPADVVVRLPTRADAALLYRLNVDRNPLHVDPTFASKAGFPRPILHGLCLYGIAARGLVQALLGWDCARLASLDVRFSGVFYPGETLELSLWQDKENISFVGRSAEREVVVLNNGLAVTRRQTE